MSEFSESEGKSERRQRAKLSDRLALRPAEVAETSRLSDCGELVTIPAAARRLGVGPRQLRRAVARGELETYHIGGWPRLRWRKVLRWLESRRAPTTSHARRRAAEVLARESRGKR